MSSAPIINPPVPFFGPIPGGVHVGKTITVMGHVPSSAHRFDINLTDAGRDVLFHFNPRYDTNCVVRNSYQRGKWGPEEDEPKHVPLHPGHPFEVMILVEGGCYKVAVNGRHFIEYAHRAPFSSVRMLKIEGDVHLSRIEYRDSVQFPTVPAIPPYPGQVCPMGPISPVPLGGHKLQPVYNPALPLTYSIHGGLQLGTNIYISGRPTANPHRFEINLQCGILSMSDISMHFNPRFSECVIIRNSRLNGHWGSEERHGTFPFQNGVTFDMCIQVQQNCFSFFINGLPFASYTHRLLPLGRIITLTIDGDVLISSVQFK